MTAHDLAADWSWMETATGFRLNGRGVKWETAQYVKAQPFKVQVSRAINGKWGVRAIVRYVDPATPVERFHK